MNELVQRLVRSFYYRGRLVITVLSAMMRIHVGVDGPRVQLIKLLLDRPVTIETQRVALIKTALNPELELSDAVKNLAYALKPAMRPDDHRIAYQQRFIAHKFVAGERVLDIGSGGDPFPYSTILADRYLEPTNHRSSEFQSLGKPVVICDIHALPFAEGAFDYSLCSHVLEHVDDPIQACAELQRVSKSGYLETPALMNDVLFAWAKGMHKWHVLAVKEHLFFFEYSDRLAAGIETSVWTAIIFGTSYHPLQEVFLDNLDIFNTILEWNKAFIVTIVDAEGHIRTTASAHAVTFSSPSVGISRAQ